MSTHTSNRSPRSTLRSAKISLSVCRASGRRFQRPAGTLYQRSTSALRVEAAFNLREIVGVAHNLQQIAPASARSPTR